MFLKKKEKVTSDEVGSYIEHLVKTNKRAFLLLILNSSITLILAVVCVYFIFLRDERVILLSPEGKPDIANTVSDRIFVHEVQTFISVVSASIFERSYIDYVNRDNLEKVYRDIENYFSPTIFRSYWNSYLKSQFVRSVIDNKLVVKVKVSSPFDLRYNKETKEIIGAGVVELLNFTPDPNVTPTVSSKVMEIKIIKGARTLRNPFGLYVISFTERL